MTVYNAAAYVAASVAAALQQSHRNYELIVLDDGSTDGTAEILQGIRDPRLCYIREARVGRAQALNHAIEAAAGQYLAINDADDLSLPGRLTDICQAFEARTDLGLLATNAILTKQFLPRLPDEFANDTSRKPKKIRTISSATLYRNNPFVHSTVAFRKTLWSQLKGYDTSLSLCIDYDFYLRASAVSTIGWLPLKTVLYYRNPDSFFKKVSLQEYILTLRRIREGVRKSLRLPFWAGFYDIVRHRQ